MPKKLKYIAIITGVMLLLGGFWAGKYVQAENTSQPEPGTSLDPLVTQSYVDSQLKAQILTLQNQITALQTQVNTLQAKVTALETKQGTTPVVNNPPASNPGTTVPGQTSSTASGKKVYPKSAGITTNVRSGAGTSFSIVAKISSTSPGIFVSEKNGWYYIKLSTGKYGWVRKDVVILK